jgi:hypothetical protein
MDKQTSVFCHPWLATRRFRAVSGVLLAAAVCVSAVYGILLRKNDFDVHLQFGRDFLDGQPFRSNPYQYLLGRMMFDAGLASLNYYAARALVFFSAIAALVASLYLWERIARDRHPLPAGQVYAAAVFSIGLLSANIARDLDECGLQILLLFFLSCAGILILRRRPISSGFWLAIASTYKTTPLLFLPFLILKRQWHALGWTLGWLLGLNLFLPSLYLGWQNSMRLNQAYASALIGIVQPGYNTNEYLDAAKPQNQSLLAAGFRYLMSYPPSHPGFVDHPWFVQFGNLDAVQASFVVKGGALAALFAFAWRLRRPWTAEGSAAAFPSEWASVCLLSTLLSPMTWLHHLVVMLPAFFLLIRMSLYIQPIHSWRKAAFWVMTFIALVVHREILGKSLQILLQSYKVHTIGAVLALVLVSTIGEPVKRKPNGHERGRVDGGFWRSTCGYFFPHQPTAEKRTNNSR